MVEGREFMGTGYSYEDAILYAIDKTTDKAFLHRTFSVLRHKGAIDPSGQLRHEVLVYIAWTDNN
jgi:hypothetical protein